MTLQEIVQILRSEVDDRGDWRVGVLRRQFERAGKASERVVERAVTDVEVDHGAEEIDLQIAEGADVALSVGMGFAVRELLERLELLVDDCADYHVCAGSASMQVDVNESIRIEVPLVGVAWDVNGQLFGLLQWPVQQWRSGRRRGGARE